MSGYGVFSSEVTLTVTNDVTPPFIVTNQVVVAAEVSVSLLFSELLDPTSATNASNYVLAGGPTLGSVTLGADGKTVTLVVQNILLGDSLALTVSGVKDLAGNTMVSKTDQRGDSADPHQLRAGRHRSSEFVLHSPATVASKAIDGNTAGSWGAGSIACTANGELGWWEVDLRATRTIGSVNVWWRTDCCSMRNENIDLVIYDSTNTATRVELLRVSLTTRCCPAEPHRVESRSRLRRPRRPSGTYDQYGHE